MPFIEQKYVTNNSYLYQKICLIGCVLIHIADSLIFTWGQVNVYYYSYYKHIDESLDYQLTSFVLLCIALPIGIIQLFSIRIAHRIGFKKTIIIGNTVLCVSSIGACFMPNFQSFLGFYIALEAASYSLTGFPGITCAWSHFPEKQGFVTGVIFSCFGLSVLSFVWLLTYLINPNNEPASLSFQQEQITIYYFQYQVAQNVPKSLFIISSIQIVSAITGSLLISYKKPQLDKVNEIELATQAAEIYENQIQENFQNPQKCDSQAKNSICPISIRKEITRREFIKIYYASICLNLMILLIGLNYKQFGLSKVNDDHFLLLITTISMVVSSATNILWGFILDFFYFKYMLLICLFLSAISVILLPLLADQGKIGFGIGYTLLVIFDRGFAVILGPGLVRIFGVTLGPQLYPIMNSSTMLCLVITPLLQLILNKFISFDYQLYFVGLLIISGSLVITTLKLDKKQDIQEKKEQFQKTIENLDEQI